MSIDLTKRQAIDTDPEIMPEIYQKSNSSRTYKSFINAFNK